MDGIQGRSTIALSDWQALQKVWGRRVGAQGGLTHYFIYVAVVAALTFGAMTLLDASKVRGSLGSFRAAAMLSEIEGR